MLFFENLFPFESIADNTTRPSEGNFFNSLVLPYDSSDISSQTIVDAATPVVLSSNSSYISATFEENTDPSSTSNAFNIPTDHVPDLSISPSFIEAVGPDEELLH